MHLTVKCVSWDRFFGPGFAAWSSRLYSSGPRWPKKFTQNALWSSRKSDVLPRWSRKNRTNVKSCFYANSALNFVKEVLIRFFVVQAIMAFVWQEQMHDDNDIQDFADVGCQNALRACGLLKFFLTSHLRSQPDLLELLIRAWNPTDGKFIIRGRDIEFDATDIYFLTGLSRCGERPILEGQRLGGDSLETLMAQVCPRARKTKSGKVSIPSPTRGF